jgi:glycosyltransferase involved in cell wall biosynthesis
VTQAGKPFVVSTTDSTTVAVERRHPISPAAALVTATVIVPFHRNLTQLAQCLAAIRVASPATEVIVAADGAVDDCHALAIAQGARVVEIAGPPRGPAAARNRAAAVATGEMLLFVDTDVVVAPDAIGRLLGYLQAHPDVAGVFGAYDEQPPEPNFSSRYRNLSHSYIHQVARARALTFWAGLGAVRTDAFRAVGGFDERFRRPSVEDIDLGYRLSAAGYELRIEPAARGRHLKRWTLVGGAISDIRDRGVPWTQLILRSRLLADDLNTTWPLRISLALSNLILAAMLAALVAPVRLRPASLFVGLAALAGLLALNWRYYEWFYQRGGFGFAARVVAVHILHHLCNGISLAYGTIVTFATRAGLRLPGALPTEPWTGSSSPAGSPAAMRASRS